VKKALQNGPVDIGEVIQHGVVFDFKNWRGGTVDAAHLPQAVAHLFDLLEKRAVDYVLVGGVALLQYVEGRNTQDVDLIVDAPVLDNLPGLEVTERDENFARATFEGLRVDFLLTRHPLFLRVRERYSSPRPFQGRTIRCGTVEGLILLKLFSLPSLYRQGEFARVGLYENDVATLFQAYHPAMDRLLEELRPHLSDSDFSEVSRIVAEVGARVRRFERGRKSE
jgi:hypothetical protein